MTTTVVNKRGYTLDIPGHGLVGPGEEIEVPEKLAKSLLEQDANWAKPSKKASSTKSKSSEEE